MEPNDAPTSSTTDPPELGPVVFILGAGFSRAVSEYMPLTDELGDAALESLRRYLPRRLALDRFPVGMNFEQWLSQLAAKQPYLSDAENVENRAAFIRFSEAIAEIIGARVQRVLANPYPEWLLTFASTAHHTQATIITFNYDTILECLIATPTGVFGDPNHYGQVWQGVSWTELTGDLPPWPPGSAILGAERVETFRLLKLHGSLNWYWRSDDTSGQSVARRVLPGVFGEPQPYVEEERRRALPGRVPFVVPPSASKSDYYGSPITQEMWRQAAERLRAASRIVLLGYSIPKTDTTFGNLMRDSAADNVATSAVLVADYAPEPVVKRLIDLGISKDRITSNGSGAMAIPTHLAEWSEEVSRAVLAKLSLEQSELPLLLAWGDAQAYSPVDEITADTNEILLFGSATYSSFAGATGIGSRPALTARQVKDHLDRSGSARLCLQAASGSSRGSVVALFVHQVGTGQGNGKWVVLQVASTPPVPEFP